MTAAIVNNRIAGTRITVWDIVYYLENGRDPEYIAEILPVTVEQVQAAVRYIEEHKEEVMAVHRQIEERNARGNPPEIEAKLAESRAKRLALMEQLRKAKRQEGNGEGPGS
jgi:uncharacterized protein (DUF433 family)